MEHSLKKYDLTTIRIPTIEYGYIEFPFQGTPEEAIAEHNRIINLYNGGFGLEPKEFNKALDEILKTGKLTNGADLYPKMSKEQQNVLQELKKALKRITYDETKGKPEDISG